MTNSDFSILPAQPEHAVVLSAIAHAAKRHWGYPEAWIQRWAKVLTVTPEYVERHAVFIARSGDAIVGFQVVALRGGHAQLEHLWVLPAAMGQGIGRALFAHAEAGARQSGATRLWVESDPHAEGFYQRMGMTVFDRKPAPMDDQPRFLPLLEKNL